ncbi:hypothetical protein QMZ93_03795 [Pantoea stewartii subsp. indologenes]|uniref:hypothetical protein n=1 Tax=Pantoea TaxID=53335 RepID=UPI00197F5C41|nr:MULTISPECIES: hypothetical protein [Pantoea]MDF7785498.1 hypothetical protein [Pantoea stewartii]MDK2632470.1 hypothetical protein [Pantoea stewartii subsp. indologenes]WRH20641.1 hypothetical protein GC090_08140 [Pantoea sp. JZ29]
MTLYDITMYTIIFLFFLIGFLHIYASFLFKKNSEKYAKIIRDFNNAGLQLDTTTKFSSNLGFYANYQKLSYLYRLQKGVKMKFRQNEEVREEAYNFIQSQPKNMTAWIADLVVFYKAIFALTAVFGFLLFFFVYILN